MDPIAAPVNDISPRTQQPCFSSCYRFIFYTSYQVEAAQYHYTLTFGAALRGRESSNIHPATAGGAGAQGPGGLGAGGKGGRGERARCLTCVHQELLRDAIRATLALAWAWVGQTPGPRLPLEAVAASAQMATASFCGKPPRPRAPTSRSSRFFSNRSHSW
jgi:hypothetical protein